MTKIHLLNATASTKMESWSCNNYAVQGSDTTMLKIDTMPATKIEHLMI